MFDYHTPENFDVLDDKTPSWTLTDAAYPSKTTGTTRRCHVILPPSYSESKKYPVLYLLHGIGGTEDEWLDGNPVAILSNLSAQGLVSDMVVVIPNVRAAADDRVPQDVYGPVNCAAFDNFINDLRDDLMPFITANYSVKTGRENTAIAGLSMGGRESLFIGVTMSEVFGYVGAFSPAPGLLRLEGMPFPGQISKEDFRIPSGKPAPFLLLVCNGEQDMIVRTVAAVYVETLTQNGVENLNYTMPGGHDFTVWKNGLYHFASRIFR